MRRLAVALILSTLPAMSLAAPIIYSPESTFDFGTILQGQDVTHIFTVENRGTNPLLLGDIRTTCGCTAATTSNKNLLPGGNATIKVVFDSKDASGRTSKEVVIANNDPTAPSYSLRLTGTVSPRFQVAPAQVNLGMLAAGSIKTITLSVTNHSGETTQILSAGSAQQFITQKLVFPVSLPVGKTIEIPVSVTAPKEGRFISGTLTIKTTSRHKPEIAVPIYGTIGKL